MLTELVEGADKINQQVNIGHQVKSNLLIISKCALTNIVCCAAEMKQICGFLKITIQRIQKSIQWN